MRTLVLIFLFIAVPLAAGTLKPEQESDYWQGTGIDLAFARQVINNEKCSSAEQHFHACRKAMIEGARLALLSTDARFKKLAYLKYRKNFDFESLLTAIVKAPVDVPSEMIIGKVVNAYMRAHDPYSRLMPSAFVELLLNGQSKTYFGLGLETEETGAGLKIFQVYPNTPAENAGLKIHDRIVSINGLSARNELEAHALGQALSVGRAGEKFALEIGRHGRKFMVNLETMPLVIPETSDDIYSIDGKNIGYLRLRSFSDDACLHLQQKVEIWQNQAAKLNGLILDLRHNSGGLVNEGQCIAQLFVGNRTIVTREPLQLDFPASLHVENAKLPPIESYPWQRTFSDLPLVILINERSASASEFVAGALQDYQRAWIVGERSYGKGTTQLIHRLPDYPKLRALRTVSHYLRPSGVSTQSVGVTPNFSVPFEKSASLRARVFLREEDMRKSMKLPASLQWQESRPGKVALIGTCLAKRHNDATADFQLATALGIFACDP